jgi:hypothetical protein
VEPAAIEMALEECLADEEVRDERKRREAQRRERLDHEYVGAFADPRSASDTLVARWRSPRALPSTRARSTPAASGARQWRKHWIRKPWI